MLRLEAPLFYANAGLVADLVKQLVGGTDSLPRVAILDIGANGGLDITSSEMLEGLVTALRNADIDFALADVRQPVIGIARRSGLLAALGEDQVFRTIDEAVQALAPELASPSAVATDGRRPRNDTPPRSRTTPVPTTTRRGSR